MNLSKEDTKPFVCYEFVGQSSTLMSFRPWPQGWSHITTFMFGSVSRTYKFCKNGLARRSPKIGMNSRSALFT